MCAFVMFLGKNYFLGIFKGETVSDCKGIKWTFKPGQEINHYFNVKFWHQILWLYNTVSVILAV